MIYEGILGPYEGFQTLQKEPSDFPANIDNLGVAWIEARNYVYLCYSISCYREF